MHRSYMRVLVVVAALLFAGFLAIPMLKHPLSQQEAKILEDKRFAEYCPEYLHIPCDDFIPSIEPQRSSDNWLFEYQSKSVHKTYIALIVHDNQDIEISKFQDE